MADRIRHIEVLEQARKQVPIGDEEAAMFGITLTEIPPDDLAEALEAAQHALRFTDPFAALTPPDRDESGSDAPDEQNPATDPDEPSAPRREVYASDLIKAILRDELPLVIVTGPERVSGREAMRQITDAIAASDSRERDV